MKRLLAKKRHKKLLHQARTPCPYCQKSVRIAGLNFHVLEKHGAESLLSKKMISSLMSAASDRIRAEDAQRVLEKQRLMARKIPINKYVSKAKKPLKPNHVLSEQDYAAARIIALKYKYPLDEAIKLATGKVKNRRGKPRGPLFGKQHVRRFING